MGDMLARSTGWRVKRVRVGVAAVLNMLTGQRLGEPFVEVPVMAGLPDGYAVVGIDNIPAARAFDIYVSHPSFDEIAEGESPPDFGGHLCLQWHAVTPATPEEIEARNAKDPDWWVKDTKAETEKE